MLGKQQVIMGAFTAMSIASGQHFLSEINSNLTAINQKKKMIRFLNFYMEIKKKKQN